MRFHWHVAKCGTMHPPYFAILYNANLPYLRLPHVPQRKGEEEAGLSCWDLPLGMLMHARVPPGVYVRDTFLVMICYSKA